MKLKMIFRHQNKMFLSTLMHQPNFPPPTLFCYLYLPRLVRSDVLVRAISDGIPLLTWETDTFAYAESHDEAANLLRQTLEEEQLTDTKLNDLAKNYLDAKAM